MKPPISIDRRIEDLKYNLKVQEFMGNKRKVEIIKSQISILEQRFDNRLSDGAILYYD